MTDRVRGSCRKRLPRFSVDLSFALTINGLDHRGLHLAFAGLLFVGADDHLHELVAHDVFIGEVDKLDAFDVRENALRLYETATFAGRKIDLRHVAGDHGFGAVTDARKKHLHLLAGRVLRFVENDERVRECAAAHERERRDFHHSFLEQARDAFVIDEIKQRVVKRTQVRIDLVL